MPIEEAILVWNADNSIRGHLTYALHKIRGHDDCSLCQLTHGSITEKPEWKATKSDLGVPISAVYRNDLTAEQAAAANGDLPCVIARTPGGLVKLLSRDEIESCHQDLDCFTEKLRAAIAKGQSPPPLAQPPPPVTP